MGRHGRYQRLGTRYGRLVAVLFLVATALVVGVFFFLWTIRPDGFRTSGVIVGSPMTIFSWNGAHSKLLILSIPSEVNIEGVSGVGSYSLQSLWKLGIIDTKKKDLLVKSLEHALGAPLPWYIGVKGDQLESPPSPLSAVRGTFSFSALMAFVTGKKYQTNLSLVNFVSFALSFMNLSPSDITTIDLADKKVLTDIFLPDASLVPVVDINRLDVLLGTQLEDERIRKESLSVVVRNTTNRPLLGTRVARLLSRTGALVVSVTNGEPVVERCELLGKREALSSVTAKFILMHYDCLPVASPEQERADLILNVGKSYERAVFGVN